ncbi:thiolase family protein [Sporichthya brevicatena]|uniref:propanoyl-CoA C-acyltransferase n=2 Tax=Sporichthya brevicatena TaxID=171442 RepID=A0ABP3RGD3_9ACTN
MTVMADAWVAGAAMTAFGRSPHGPEALASQAVAAALADAGLAATEIGQVFLGNAAAGLLLGQEMIRGQVFLRASGLLGAPIVNVENACASSSSALALAVTAVRGGMLDAALAVGVEKMTVPDKARVFGALASATDTLRRPDMRTLVATTTLGEPRPAGESAPTASAFMDHYAHKGAVYLEKAGGDVTDLARVVVKSRAFAALNPKAQFTTPTTVEEVLGGRVISDPLRLSMCAPIGDGAAAVVVVSDRLAKRLGRRVVRVAGQGIVSNDPTTADFPAGLAAAKAFIQAGVGPHDVDVVEVHDAAAPAELFCLEEIGLCPEGGALGLLRDGITGPGGRRPVNPSGGLLSRGHPVGATGCGQIVELTDQLRGRCGARQVPGARLALAQNSGGILGDHEAVAVVTILERTTR